MPPSLRERVIAAVKETGVLPCIKLSTPDDVMPYAEAMRAGGARAVEVTMTTPNALGMIEAISKRFGDQLFVAAGTVLDPETARQVILHGGSILVSPALRPKVIRTAHRYGVPVFSGAFTATECLQAIEAGATMVKIFPAELGGPKYMTNLRMVYPELDLIPSGGVSLANAGEFIRCGACAVSGNRVFMDHEAIASEGFEWLTKRVAQMIEAVRAARQKPLATKGSQA